jgi:hypothetical protein
MPPELLLPDRQFLGAPGRNHAAFDRCAQGMQPISPRHLAITTKTRRHKEVGSLSLCLRVFVVQDGSVIFDDFFQTDPVQRRRAIVLVRASLLSSVHVQFRYRQQGRPGPEASAEGAWKISVDTHRGVLLGA